MADNTEISRLEAIAELFDRHGVESIIIGGQAATLHGSPIPTYDIDVCYARTADNLRRLATALSEIHPSLRGAPPDLPFRLDAQSLALGSNFTFNTDLGPLDLLGRVEPFGGFETLIPRAEMMELEGRRIAVICLADLIAIKRHINRPKDQAAVLQLEAIQRLRGSAG